jgi:hypothetical protein
LAKGIGHDSHRVSIKGEPRESVGDTRCVAAGPRKREDVSKSLAGFADIVLDFTGYSENLLLAEHGTTARLHDTGTPAKQGLAFSD